VKVIELLVLWAIKHLLEKIESIEFVFELIFTIFNKEKYHKV